MSTSGHTTHCEPHGTMPLPPSAIPKTRWAKTVDGVWIAYQDFGKGPLTLVFMNGLYSHLEVYWEESHFREVKDGEETLWVWWKTPVEEGASLVKAGPDGVHSEKLAYYARPAPS